MQSNATAEPQQMKKRIFETNIQQNIYPKNGSFV